MTRTVQLALGLFLVVIACAGVLAMTRAFDASASTREVRVAKFANAWSRTDDGRASLALGRVALPQPGVLRVVVCPHRAANPRATLRVFDAAGRRVANEDFTADESRGKRCFDASFRADRAGTYSAAVTTPPGAVERTIKRAELFSSRRITLASAWPVLTLLLGLLLAARAPRRDPASTPDDAPPPAPTPPPVPGIPAGWVGGIMPPGMLAPNVTAAAPGAEAPAVWAAPSPPAADARPVVEWSFSWVYALLAYVAVHIAMAFVAAAYVVAHGGAAAVTETGTFVAFTLLVQHAMLIGTAAFFLGAFRGRDVRAALGVVPLSSRQIAEAVGAGVVLILVAFASTKLIRDVSSAPIAQLIERMPARLAIGFGALLAPFSEELFFRGVLVRAFGKRSVVVGVAVSTVIFTAAHALQLWGAWAGLIPICSVALVNGWLRVRSGGISQPWLVHTIYNGALSAGLYLGG